MKLPELRNGLYCLYSPLKTIGVKYASIFWDKNSTWYMVKFIRPIMTSNIGHVRTFQYPWLPFSWGDKCTFYDHMATVWANSCMEKGYLWMEIWVSFVKVRYTSLGAEEIISHFYFAFIQCNKQTKLVFVLQKWCRAAELHPNTRWRFKKPAKMLFSLKLWERGNLHRENSRREICPWA